jgi:hypothetical protein
MDTQGGILALTVIMFVFSFGVFDRDESELIGAAQLTASRVCN